MSEIKIDLSLLKPSDFEGLRKSLLEEAKKDPKKRDAYVKTRVKVANEIRRDKLLEQHPEIALELDRQKQIKEQNKTKKAAEQLAEKVRKDEIRTARQARIAHQENLKKQRAEELAKLFADAGLSDETSKRIVKAASYERRNNENEIVSVKCLVSFKTKEGKYDKMEDFIDFQESEEKTLDLARNALIRLLIDVDNQ